MSLPQGFIYLRGTTGETLNVDASGRLLVTDNPSASGFILGAGNTGRNLAVDGNGRLHVSLAPGSGLALPDLSSSVFGASFYLVGSGFYRRGITSWEQETNA